MSLINNSQNFDRLLKEMVYIPHLKVNIVYREVGHYNVHDILYVRGFIIFQDKR
jgi:hypothetical protein